MRKMMICGLLCAAVVPLLSCSRSDTPTSPTESAFFLPESSVDPELAAGEMILAGGWEFDAATPLPAKLGSLADKDIAGGVQCFQREVLTGDIVHYSVVLSVGPGVHDVVGLHRVVRERRPGAPIRAPKSVFLMHGMGKDFVGNFLPGRKSPLLPDDLGFAVFMAQNDIDVWGLDSRYTLVPTGLEDFGFAAGWGMDMCLNDIGTGIAVARATRLFTGNGLRKMVFIGYSQGAIMGYGYLNREAQLPSRLRSVSAFVPVDWGLAFDDPEVQQGECEFLGGYVDLLADGVYGFYDDPDGFFASLGFLAQTEPDGPSPYYDDLTNLQVFLFYTAVATPPSTAHWWAASFDEEGMPQDFTYTARLMATEFWIRWAPMHPPTRYWADLYAINCEDSRWETHLGQIDLPVLSLEASGGYGPGMAATLDGLTSAAVTRHVVQLQPAEDVLLDYGHIDLFTAGNAAETTWQPTLNWIANLRGQDAVEPPPPDTVLSPAQLERLVAAGRTPPPGDARFDAIDAPPTLRAPGKSLESGDNSRSARARRSPLSR